MLCPVLFMSHFSFRPMCGGVSAHFGVWGVACPSSIPYFLLLDLTRGDHFSPSTDPPGLRTPDERCRRRTAKLRPTDSLSGVTVASLALATANPPPRVHIDFAPYNLLYPGSTEHHLDKIPLEVPLRSGHPELRFLFFWLTLNTVLFPPKLYFSYRIAPFLLPFVAFFYRFSAPIPRSFDRIPP